jgi:hypothetical protein
MLPQVFACRALRCVRTSEACALALGDIIEPLEFKFNEPGMLRCARGWVAIAPNWPGAPQPPQILFARPHYAWSCDLQFTIGNLFCAHSRSGFKILLCLRPLAFADSSARALSATWPEAPEPALELHMSPSPCGPPLCTACTLQNEVGAVRCMACSALLSAQFLG